jgi:hypothetical protein
MTMTVEEFAGTGHNGSVIESALIGYIETMRKDADLLLASAYCPAGPPKEPRPGYIDITPTPAGLRMTSEIFCTQAAQAETVLAAWRAEANGELTCDVCGADMWLSDGGTAHHWGSGPDDVDHDADNDHVPYHR